MEFLQSWFGLTPTTRVLDVGGDPYNWQFAPVRPRITIVNLYAPRGPIPPDIHWLVGDARDLSWIDDGHFDLVYSNSVIEHLGTWEAQVAMAREVMRIGRAYFVQTPDKVFPVEPHLLTPFVHYLPRDAQRRILRYGTTWGWLTRATAADCDAFMAEVRLLGYSEMLELFPSGQIRREYLMGLPKSLLALYKAPQQRN